MDIKHLLLGAGGHALVVLDAIQKSNPELLIEVRDDNPALQGKEIGGVFIKIPVGKILPGYLVHVAVGDNKYRRHIYENLPSTSKAFTVIHSNAIISRLSHIAEGCFIAAQAIIAPRACLDMGVIINHGAIVDHDCEIGAYTHIAPNVTLGGAVTIGRNCLIGANATVLPGIVIEDDVVVGAGAVVTRRITKGKTVVGIPAQERN